MDGDLVVPMEDMGEAYQRLANHKRVGGAVKASAKYEPLHMSIHCQCETVQKQGQKDPMLIDSILRHLRQL